MRRRLALLGALALGLVIGPAGLEGQAPLRVQFLDVGQGDAVLIQSPSGQNVLYDAGPSGPLVLERLRAAGVTSLDLVIASHNHADHIGGMADVLRQYRPRVLMGNGIDATTATYRRMLEAAEEVGAQWAEPTRRRIMLGDVVLTVLPPPGPAAWGHNDNSVGLRVEYGAFQLLLTGDAESRQWAWWAEHHSDLMQPVRVLKASHHGSNNGDTRTSLARLAPHVVVISVGGDNRYGHPHPAALARYGLVADALYRTDLDGTVLIEAGRDGRFRVLTERMARSGPTAPLRA